MYCISSALERKHEIASTSWSFCLWKLCVLVSSNEEQLCILFMYTWNLSIISTISQFESDSKMCTFHLIWSAFVCDVWTTDLGFCQVSLLTHFPWQGLKHCNFVWLQLPFSLPGMDFVPSLSPFFFMFCDWGSPSFLCPRIVFIFVTLDLCLLLIYRDLWNSRKWQILISNLQSLSLFPWILIWIFFLIFWDSWPETSPPPFFFLSFPLWKTCSKCLPLNCHYHQIGFALKQDVPVSYYSKITLYVDNRHRFIMR